MFHAIRSAQPYQVEILSPTAGTVGDYQSITVRVLYVQYVNPPVYCHVWLVRDAPPAIPALSDLLLAEERPLSWPAASWSEPLGGEGVVEATAVLPWPTTEFYNDNYDLKVEVHFGDFWEPTDLLAPVVSRSYAVRNLVIR